MNEQNQRTQDGTKHDKKVCWRNKTRDEGESGSNFEQISLSRRSTGAPTMIKGSILVEK